jgi:hypothetical protein
MATLVSPGVSISVSDESFYAPAGAGTVPLIVIATAKDKTAPDGTSTAAYTTSATAGKLYQITSQRELLQSYGNPNFKVSGGTPVHGDETNEYGLMAAYSYLGISNRAYVLRADVDLAQLEASADAPSGAPSNGAYWLDSASSVWGIKVREGSKWVSESANVLVPNASQVQSNGTPKSAFGKNDEFCVRYFDADGTSASDISLYQKKSGTWYKLGSSAWTSASSKDFQFASHLSVPTTRSDASALQDGDVYLATTDVAKGSDINLSKYNSASSQWIEEGYAFKQYSSSANGVWGSDKIKGSLWLDHDGEDGEASIVAKAWNGASTLTVQSTTAISDTAISNASVDAVNPAFKINVDASTTAIDVFFTSETNGNLSVDDMVTDIQSALSSANVTTTNADQVSASNVDGKVTLINSEGKDIELSAGTSAFSGLGALFLSAKVYSNWEAISYEPKASAPVGATANATLWYDADISTNNIDLLIHDGIGFVTLTNDHQTKATEPTVQSDGSSSLVDGDIWINSGDSENIKLYRHDGSDWNLIDLTDQSTADGIVFGDFRKSASGSLDADSPKPSLYPAGILAWNLRASGGNVKEYRVNYTVGSDVIGNTWVSHSGLKSDGSAYLLRKAQRRSVVKGLQAAVASNDDIRNETNRFNVVAVPGYPELTDEMLGLSVDRKDTVFALIDPPFRLESAAQSVKNWATNSGNAAENGEDGLLSSSAQSAVYYPHGLSTNLDGTNVMVPASHMALRTIAFNDQVAFPWFAPAGFQRGLVSNATSVGYLDPAEGEFTPVSLNEGQRDAYYLNKVNPIASFPGRGIAVFGQKTLNPSASALDRVNVSRLVIYIREQLDDAVKPFLFEPNDSVTRGNAKGVVDRFLSELVTQRGLYDFVTVCDTTNNTPARIDRNELHIDVAIQPVKAVEFIYIPIRIQNTLGSTA